MICPLPGTLSGSGKAPRSEAGRPGEAANATVYRRRGAKRRSLWKFHGIFRAQNVRQRPGISFGRGAVRKHGGRILFGKKPAVPHSGDLSEGRNLLELSPRGHRGAREGDAGPSQSGKNFYSVSASPTATGEGR